MYVGHFGARRMVATNRAFGGIPRSPRGRISRSEVRLYIYIYIYTYTYIFIYIHIHIERERHTHTHTHTHVMLSCSIIIITIMSFIMYYHFGSRCKIGDRASHGAPASLAKVPSSSVSELLPSAACPRAPPYRKSLDADGKAGRRLTASRRGRDKRGHRRSAATPDFRRKMWQNVAAYGNMCALEATCGEMRGGPRPFCENPVCPDPVWKSLSGCSGILCLA